MPATEPPRPIGDMYDLVHSGIDILGSGDGYALEQLARLTAEVPRWIRLHLEMEHCIEPATPVLRGDLRWVPAGSLNCGDNVVAFDESPDNGVACRWRYATVTNNGLEEMDAWEVLLDNGDRCVVSGTHRWKSGAGNGGGGSSRNWVYTKNLIAGKSKLAKYVDVWAEDCGKAAGWLAGIFDGEGSVAKASGQLFITQRPGIVLDSLRTGLSELGFSFREGMCSSGLGRGDARQLSIRGGIAGYMRFLGTVRPLRLLENFVLPRRRFQTMDTALVVSVRQIGRHMLSTLSTSSGTFLARGYGAHNTFPSPSGVMRCRLAQWYDFKQAVPDQKSPLGWKVRRVMGVMAEPYWLAVLASGGASLELPNAAYPCGFGADVRARPDAIQSLYEEVYTMRENASNNEVFTSEIASGDDTQPLRLLQNERENGERPREPGGKAPSAGGDSQQAAGTMAGVLEDAKMHRLRRNRSSGARVRPHRPENEQHLAVSPSSTANGIEGTQTMRAGMCKLPPATNLQATSYLLQTIGQKELARRGFMLAHPDARMDGDFLVELKSETGVGYKILLETPGGVELAEKAHYVQAQLYMHATGDEWALYLTSPPDYGLLQSDMRRYKKYGQHYILPPVYLEWIHRDEQTIEMALGRAEMLAKDQAGGAPQRENSGVEFKISGKRTWPCGYCLHLAKCQRDSAPDRAGTANGEISFV